MARFNGAARVIATDLVEGKLAVAKRCGVDVALNARELTPDRLRQVNDGRLADLVIICASAPRAIEQALASVERGGTVLFFAAADQGTVLPLDINKIFWRNEVTLTSSYAASPAEHLEALQLIADGKVRVKELITHRFGLADAQKGFELVAQGKEAIKVIIEPQQ